MLNPIATRPPLPHTQARALTSPEPLPPPPDGRPPEPPQDGPVRRSRPFFESLAGTAIHQAIGAVVGGGIGLAIGRSAKGAAWGAGIGSALAQGFMQFVARMADGARPVAVAIPGVAALAAGWGGFALAGAAGLAWGVVLAPAAVLGAAFAWDQLTGQR